MGFINIDRKIQNHWLWTNKEPFDKRSAWFDLLLLASYKDHSFQFGYELVNQKEGEIITSEHILADKWKWSRHKVRNFLELLIADSMLVKNSTTKRTSLTIVNYKLYQGSMNQQKDCKRTTEEPPKDSINKGNKEKNIYIEKIPVKNNNNEVIKNIIDYLNSKTGKSFKPSTAATIKIITARIKEDFTEDDFKKVVDIKVAEWSEDEIMAKYLRPATLFNGEKFEGYLNQTSKERRTRMV
jgi:uncharacterized phage protein (TIGR02220 family)